MRPLYQEANEVAPTEWPGHSNAGLWYDKFCDWPDDFAKFDKNKWISKLHGKKVGNPCVLAEHAARRTALAAACGGVTLEWKTASRFLTGLGRDHPVENGFAWHHLLGVPYLPGSGVKGVVRSWAEVWGASDDAALCEMAFGVASDTDNTGGKAGSILFLDALPVGPVRLEGEVMTPHLGGYYLASLENPADLPGEWHAPIPIPLLATAKGQTFQFCLLPRTPDAAEALPKLANLLAEALQIIGAGAKTASGYGRFASDAGTIAAPAKAEPLEEFCRWFDAQKFNATNKGAQHTIIEKVEAMPEDARPKAKEYIGSKLKKKERTDKLHAFITQ